MRAFKLNAEELDHLRLQQTVLIEYKLSMACEVWLQQVEHPLKKRRREVRAETNGLLHMVLSTPYKYPTSIATRTHSLLVSTEP